VPMLRRASAGPGTVAAGTATLAPRAAALAGAASLCYVAVAVLMTWKPGG